MGKNAIFHIYVKSEPGYSPKYPEDVFSVIGLSLCRHGHDHKLWQFKKCDGKDSWIVAICDCRILWRFKMPLLRFMSVMQKGILFSAGDMYRSTSSLSIRFLKVSQIHVRNAKGYTLQCRRHVQIDVVTINKVSFVNWIWTLQLIYIHTNIYTSETTPKWAKMPFFIFMSKVNLGTLLSTQNTFSVLLD